MTTDCCTEVKDNICIDKYKALMISRYITVFRNTMIPVLKSNVVLQPTVYPYPDGVVLVVRFCDSGLGNIVFAQPSDSLKEAWQTAELPVGMMPSHLSNPHSVIFAGDKVVGIKSLDRSCWSARRASGVANKIIETVRAIINK